LVIEPTPHDGHTNCSKKTKNNADAHASVKWVSLTEKEQLKAEKRSYCAANKMNSLAPGEKCKKIGCKTAFSCNVVAIGLPLACESVCVRVCIGRSILFCIFKDK